MAIANLKERWRLARALLVPHSAPMDDAMAKTILAVLERTPEWIRHDLVAKDTTVRACAEETLAAMIASSLSQANRSA